MSAVETGTATTSGPADRRAEPAAPLYWRVLRLRTLRPNGWQRAMLVEGVLTVAVILTLADVASAWTLLALPLASMLLVKGHDLLATALRSPGSPDDDPGHTNGATPSG